VERVKSAYISGCVLLLTRILVANSCAVENVAEQQSSQHVEISVLEGRKPMGGVRIDIYPYDAGKAVFPGAEKGLKRRLTVVSNPEGKLRSMKLRPGYYYVVAKAATDLRADLYLNVLPDSAKRSAFSMHLNPPCKMPPPAPAQWTTASEQIPIRDRVRAFSGTVYEQSGVPIPETSIKVIRKGSEGKEQVAEIKSDADGHFAVQLPEGFYIAFFFCPVFANAIVPFEVTREGTGELRVMLMVRSTT
jgi:hypothetical protein